MKEVVEAGSGGIGGGVDGTAGKRAGKMSWDRGGRRIVGGGLRAGGYKN